MAVQLPEHVPHSGIYLPMKQQEGHLKGQNFSDTDRTCTVVLSDSKEAISLGVKTSTTVSEIQDILASMFQKYPTDIILKTKMGAYQRVLKARDEVPSVVTVVGIKSFGRSTKKYDHPIFVLGAGLGAIQAMIDMQIRGRTDIVCMEAHEDFGGHSWIKAANKFTKLQTERGTYHVNYCLPWQPVPFKVGELDYKTWPSRDALLYMMRQNAREHDLYKYCMFNCQVEKLVPKNGAYAVQYVPTDELWCYKEEGDGGMMMVGFVSAWPGFLHLPNMVDFPGEDEFGGYMEYSSFDKVDYDLCTGKICTLYGHGAFTIENVRTLVEHRCKKCYVLCRTRNLSGTKCASWLVGSQQAPVAATVLLDAFSKMYNLVGFDVWSAHAVHTDAKRSFAQISQKTIFGVTDIYFLAGYYDLMTCIVDEVKRISHQCIHTKKGKKINTEVFIKAIGTKPSFKVDKQLGIKEVVGAWINGDPQRFVQLGAKGVQAKNFGSFSVGPGFAPSVQMCNWFLDYPEDWWAVYDKLPKNKAGEWPAYVTQATYGLPMGMALSANLPGLAGKMGEADVIKARKQWESHPLEVYHAECIREWESYTAFFKKHNMVDDRPDCPYPYTLETMYELIDKANKVASGQSVSFF
eukprot:CAMPEP_0204531224 /NCGR_PEP_ID=MMETSP0661-20131031/11049_1 /ASSEMBLY_ACC=CAM_ASM_000606 /TAXON_ID=109239 /ORGANISM="Alexandrium margalefi, Strain AMGDE01CS-322" /LENGTH=631 /DNA_ID=CAMNT_0051537365 /DNA_START=67 /DNA_END=1962 /DNA_ORIENTATION=+